MKVANLRYLVSVFFVLLMYEYALAANPDLYFSKILAEVPVKNGNVDQNVYRQFDRLVPKLKNISKNKIVKLQCLYSGQPDREQDVENAYRIAASIERYLRVRHKLNLDLWVAVDIKPKDSKSLPLLTVAVFSDEIKNLDAVFVEPVKN